MNAPRIPLIVSALAAATLITASPVSAAECARPGDNPVVTWTGTAAMANNLRVYFRSDAGVGEHFVEMRSQGSRNWAVLPRASSGTETVHYRIASVTDNSPKTLSSGEISITAACQPASVPPEVSSSKLIVGSTQKDQKIPAGFECEGVIATLSDSGYLQSYRGCRKGTTAAGAGAVSEAPAAEKKGTQVSTHSGNRGSNGAPNPFPGNPPFCLPTGVPQGSPPYGPAVWADPCPTLSPSHPSQKR